MKNNKDKCMDELFVGLVNPNERSSSPALDPQLSSPSSEILIQDRITSADIARQAPLRVEESSSTLSRERKKPGRKKTNKVSFMARISDDKMEKLSWLAARFGIHKCDIIEEGLSYYLSKYEEKHGPINPADKQTAADLIL